MIHAPETLAKQLSNVSANLDMAAKEHNSSRAPETPSRILSCVRALHDIANELEQWVDKEYPRLPNGKRL
jgi:hypothetical protein